MRVRWGMVAFLALVFLLAKGASPEPERQVGLIKIQGAIGPATVTYISRSIEVSAARNDECLIIELDTPGGLLDSTKEIVQRLFADSIPTVVYVAPSGADAASAGTFITMAANVAAMAPNTSIGAAHPVSLGGGGEAQKLDDTMKKKLENYASSYIEKIATKRHRNIEWAKSSVLESASITAEKALDLKVIDLIASDVPDLLKQLEGRQVNGRTLHTAEANVVEIPMATREKVFQVLWRPEVMFILMLIAIYGIIGEMSNPGAIFPGVVGAIALVLALYMSAILPINVAGLALIVLAIGLFLLDAFAPTHGVLTVGGIISFFLGSIMLFGNTGGFRLPLGLIIPATVVTSLFFVFVVGAGLRAQLLPVKSGRERMVGQIVQTLTPVDPQGGKVLLDGECWSAVSDLSIPENSPAEVVALRELTLQIKPKS